MLNSARRCTKHVFSYLKCCLVLASSACLRFPGRGSVAAWRATASTRPSNLRCWMLQLMLLALIRPFSQSASRNISPPSVKCQHLQHVWEMMLLYAVILSCEKCKCFWYLIRKQQLNHGPSYISGRGCQPCLLRLFHWKRELLFLSVFPDSFTVSESVWPKSAAENGNLWTAAVHQRCSRAHQREKIQRPDCGCGHVLLAA